MQKTRAQSRILFLILLSILVGFFLRKVWLEDMEYKGDEKLFFSMSQKVGVVEPWPTLGIVSGAGVLNPGLSSWLIIGAGKVFGNSTPIDLVESMQVFNLLALLGFALFVGWLVQNSNQKSEEKNYWLWAFALGCVAPFSILLHRKIWPQCELPFFSVALFLSFWFRQKKFGAFLLGLFATLIGQIHMSGFFLVFSILIWTLVLERKSVRWSFVFVGMVLGLIPALPWLIYLITTYFTEPNQSSGYGWGELWKLRYFRAFMTETMGLKLDYTLGNNFSDFLSYPILFGRKTYLILSVHLGLAAILAVALIKSLVQFFRECKKASFLKTFFKKVFPAKDTTGLLVNASFWGMGIFMTLLTPKIWLHRHYMTVLFPITQLWLVRLVFKNFTKPQRVLAVIWVGMFIISFSFLYYIHTNCGSPLNEYGKAYSCQEKVLRR